MSQQQQCLPVLKKRRRINDTTNPIADHRCNGKDDDVDDVVSFSNIDQMDASEYLSLVVQQANRLPDTFTSLPTAKSDVASSSSSSAAAATLKSRHPSKQDKSARARKHVPIDGLGSSLSYLVSNRTTIRSPPSIDHLPRLTRRRGSNDDVEVNHCAYTRQWVDRTLETFSRLRDYLDQCARSGVGGKRTDRIAVPPMKDRPGWHIFCVGYDDARGNTNAYFQDSDDDDDDDNDGAQENKGNDEKDDGGVGGDGKQTPTNEDRKETASKNSDSPNVTKSDAQKDNRINEEQPSSSPSTSSWKANLPPTGYSPEVSLLLQFDQVLVRRILRHLVHYVDLGWSLTTTSSQRVAWIYALLARLERPIHRDDASVLYSLLKKLCHVRAELKFIERTKEAHHDVGMDGSHNGAQSPSATPSSDNRIHLARINVLIAIIGIYFEQGGGYAGVMMVKP